MAKNLSSYEGRMPHPQMKLQATQECSPNSLDYVFECALNSSLFFNHVYKQKQQQSQNKQTNQQTYEKYPLLQKLLTQFSISLTQVWKATPSLVSK